MSLLSYSSHENYVVSPAVKHNSNEAVKMECGRLMNAAVINKTFREMLLSNPGKSIENGYCGEKFSFTHEEKERIQTIQAHSLEEFASQLMQVIEMNFLPDFAYAQATH